MAQDALVFYSAMLALAIAVGLIALAAVIGMISLVYMLFIDYGFWGGLAGIAGVLVVVKLFGGRTSDFVVSSYDSYRNDPNMDAEAYWMHKDYEQQQAEAQARANEPSAYQHNPNLYGDNPYANKD